MKDLKPNITVREIRAREKMNQKEFGKTLGVSAQTIGSWKRMCIQSHPKIWLSYA